jgi:hypothetical protein
VHPSIPGGMRRSSRRMALMRWWIGEERPGGHQTSLGEPARIIYHGSKYAVEGIADSLRADCRVWGRTRRRGFPGGRVRTAPRGFSVETPHNVEIPHRAETFSPLSMFYFRATKSFRVNRRPGADSRAGTSRTVPDSTTLSPAFTPPRRRPGTVTLSRAGFPDNAARGGNGGRSAAAARQASPFLN